MERFFYQSGGEQFHRVAAWYRFQFNGMEAEGELFEESYTTLYRLNDPRLGRWFSIDPVVDPELSPYTSMDNNPIYFNDVFGDDVGFNIFEGSDEEQKATYDALVRNVNEIFNGKVNVTAGGNGETTYLISALSVKEGETLTAQEQVKYNYINSLILSEKTYWIGLTHNPFGFVSHGSMYGTPMTTEPFAYNMYSGMADKGVTDGKFDLVMNSNCLNESTSSVSSSNFLFMAMTGLGNGSVVNTSLFNQGTGMNVVEAGFQTATDLIKVEGDDIYHSFRMVIKENGTQGSTPFISNPATYHGYTMYGQYPDRTTPGVNDTNYTQHAGQYKFKGRKQKKYRKKYGR